MTDSGRLCHSAMVLQKHIKIQILLIFKNISFSMTIFLKEWTDLDFFSYGLNMRHLNLLVQ